MHEYRVENRFKWIQLMCLNSGQVVSVLYQQGEQVKWTRGISIVSAENRLSGQVYQYCISREQVKWTSGISIVSVQNRLSGQVASVLYQ